MKIEKCSVFPKDSRLPSVSLAAGRRPIKKSAMKKNQKNHEKLIPIVFFGILTVQIDSGKLYFKTEAVLNASV